MTHKKTNKLSPANAAYLAGLVDGEGTITLTKHNRNRQRSLAVTISNTELVILKHVLEIVGVGKITNKRRSRINHTPSYTYQITSRQALDLLSQIGPCMRSHKAGRAKLALKEYLRLTPRNGRYAQEQLRQREKFIQRFFDIRPAETTGRPHPLLRSSQTVASEEVS